MNYTKSLQHHYQPQAGWMNDPNGLVYFKGYYHVFYQHAPHHPIPWKEQMCWGHARTRDFHTWEELPVALVPSFPYDGGGCWSGTAIVKDDKLYLFYAAIAAESTIAVAVSEDGVNFEKYAGNPVIATYPPEGGPDFRDPAVCCMNGVYYCVVASGHPETQTARLLLYRSDDLLSWEFVSVLGEWENAKYAECPSIVPLKDGKCLLATSVCNLDETHFFQIMIGTLEDGRFQCELSDRFDKGPDQYAGQVFPDENGDPLLITWIPGWKFAGFVEGIDIGCMSIPRRIVVENGRICGRPLETMVPLMQSTDTALTMTDDGFVVSRTARPSLTHTGEVRQLQILHDEYIMEIFVNGGETVYSLLMC
ncbi:MAG: glycoside hydrolase family 32 protein [Clostridia bacterium]|nr:glycoside hydrolase family 32 protein [Clostridia bacterium]